MFLANLSKILLHTHYCIVWKYTNFFHFFNGKYFSIIFLNITRDKVVRMLYKHSVIIMTRSELVMLCMKWKKSAIPGKEVLNLILQH